MPAKKTTIAAAEKRVIKAEIHALRVSACKVRRDVRQAFNRSLKETDAIVKAANKAHRKHLAFAEKLIKSETRETASISRRIAILQGRLHS